jgi:hypothetical protein
MMGIEKGWPEGAVFAGDAGEKRDGMGNFRSGFCHTSLRLERRSSNTWIGEAEGRYGGDDS